jgi:hypothetical protein
MNRASGLRAAWRAQRKRQDSTCQSAMFRKNNDFGPALPKLLLTSVPPFQYSRSGTSVWGDPPKAHPVTESHSL